MRSIEEALGFNTVFNELVLFQFSADVQVDTRQRFVLSIKSECLDRLVLIGERHLRHAIDEYIEHYHIERTHQGLENRLVDEVSERRAGTVQRHQRHQRHQRLGGLLSSYYREAA